MDKIAVLDFGGQYAHLIANRIRRLNVYSEILDGDTKAVDLSSYRGIILSGGPASVMLPDSVKCDPDIFKLGIPILGICYGHQCIAHVLGGNVQKGKIREYGRAKVNFLDRRGIFEGVDLVEEVWMSHFDQVVTVPEDFVVVAETKDCPIAAMADFEKKIFSVQFHVEVTHTRCGMQILNNFVELTGAKKQWNMDIYIEEEMQKIKELVGKKNVFLMISGGVDSSVAYLLLAKALGEERVYGLYVDTGFMRMGETEEVKNALGQAGIKNLHVYDASKEYYAALSGVCEPEEKRKIIGNLFLDIQEKVSKDLNLTSDQWLLGQGTIYPDTIETGGTKHADKIKTHHNRVEKIQQLIEAGQVIEPIAQLYKDEVREVGLKLGLAEELVFRHPFPGPGLAVRILCSNKDDSPANAEELEKKINELVGVEGLNAKVLPIKSVGVQGDERTYAHPVLLYGKRLAWDELDILATQVTNHFPEVNRVLFNLFPHTVAAFKAKHSDLSTSRILTIQRADKVVTDFLKKNQIYKEIWQFPVVILPLSLDGNGESIVLRPVESKEAMTANFYPMQWELLDGLVDELKQVQGISAIFYDITNKPPGTIEWE